MKMKIIILMILMLISINNVYCEIGVYELEYDVTTKSQTYGYGNTGTFSYNPGAWNINDVEAMSTLDFLECNIRESQWHGSDETSSWDWLSLYSDSSRTNFIGTGVYGYIKSPATNSVRIQLHIGTNLNWGILTGQQTIFMQDSSSLESMLVSYCDIKPIPLQGALITRYSAPTATITSPGSGLNINHTSRFYYTFTNTYEYTYNNEMGCFNYTLYRNLSYPSKLYINNSNTLIINETSTKTSNYLTYSFELDYPIWNTIVTTENDNTIETDIDFSSLFIEPDLTQPTLTTDKTYYNTSETITINYTNIQKIYDECTGYGYNTKCVHPYELYILYPIYSDNIYNQWGAKYQMYLPYYYDDDGSGVKYDDGSITLNTSILSPQNTYIIGLLGKDGYYGKTDNIQLFSDSFTVYPANEYLNTNCEGRSVYAGTDIIIYYKVDNNSKIIIKDNDNNIINEFYNIINEGELIYTIPGDTEHLNTYPNWKVYLNNTDYSTSYNKNIEVYWSLFVSPTETPTPYPTATVDINISNQLDNLTVEIQPLKDLLYGFVYIVIDNPDYDKDNIIDENEINHWFNSLIPMCLFLLLVILYIGLKKNRD